MIRARKNDQVVAMPQEDNVLPHGTSLRNA
jgi:hypothetical protein